jgi:hypothetical protein
MNKNHSDYENFIYKLTIEKVIDYFYKVQANIEFNIIDIFLL